jgi:L,D-peptidoglycan transpeptidase YkuD (ErfK/YbiS/YcfS/YnhG family)
MPPLVATVRPTGRSEGLVTLQGQTWRCALGKGGVAPHKMEGDGATPLGPLPLRRVLYRADRGPAPACALPVEPVARDDGWCDDPLHPAYNTRIRLPHEARHEALWREDGVYDVIGVLGWNDAPVLRGRGSAIFLHVARPDYAPTEGCVALAPRELRALLATGVTGLVVLAG